ncbi:MAG: ribonuclease H-like domain-containing protein [Syntrophobacterales bacterium]|nr:MAG: ribonuclease H-like domain-containing protein [Syntrophobacterales bacterium]
MKIRDKLNCHSIRRRDGERATVLSDLRRRLDRLSDPRRAEATTHGYPHRGKAIEELVDGQFIPTPFGEVFVVMESHGFGYRHGGVLLEELLEVPYYPAHCITKDKRLKGIDFSRTLFIDTETTGLAGGTGTYAFMVGVGSFQGGGFTVQQLFMRNHSEEKAMLFQLGELLDRHDFLVTFNGKNFDIPLLETRFILSRLNSPLADKPNYDLLFPSRRIWRRTCHNCRLVTLEDQLLDIHREDDIPAERIPSLYFDFVRTGDARKISRVFYHNTMDILSMVILAHRIHLTYHDPSAFSSRRGIEHMILGKLFMEHGLIEKATACLEEALKGCDESFQWETMRFLSLAYKRRGLWERSVALWEDMISWDGRRSSFPYVELAKYYEHRVKHYPKALETVRKAFEMVDFLGFSEREALLHRRSRVLKKERRMGNRSL